MAFDLTILSMAKGLAAHSAQRQGLIAENVANADTRAYRARDVKPFSEVYDGPGADPSAPRAPGASTFIPATSRAGHFDPTERVAATGAARSYEITRIGADSPNGNSVSIEDQMVRGARAMSDHQMALGILRKSMDLIRMAIGRA
ncbi:flagellar basal body rod protein FlgB [Pikeienuella sp. HZG-20]|uniref:flagellar basal body rod protein FlgB n=1 Tax=Paludibacillus litoralis TaxID=3133267 RepID=UPI0030EDA827